MQCLELVATRRGPVLVAVLREQLASVQSQRRAISAGGTGATGLLGRALEVVDVDARAECQQLVAELDRLGAERAPCDMDDLMEVVRGRGGVELGPQLVHQ